MANEMLLIKNFTQEVHELSEEYILQLSKIMHDICVDEQSSQEWLRGFKERIIDFYKHVIQNAKKARNELMENIEDLLRKIEELCRQLRIGMPLIGSKKLGLFEEKKSLLRIINEYEVIIQSRKKKIIEMITREKDICRCLGVEPKLLPDEPLPSQEDLVQFEEHIALLEGVKLKREERYLKLKCDIVDVVKQLRINPSLELEKIVMSPDNSLFMVTETNMEWLESYYLSLIDQREKRELSNLLEKRELLLSQILELREKPPTKERLKNRGGQLLREEKERKTLSKTLSKIEEELAQLADKFEMRCGYKFQSSGETIDEIIKNSNSRNEMNNKLKLSPLKKKVPGTPRGIGLLLPPKFGSCKTLVELGKSPRMTPKMKSTTHTPSSTAKRKLGVQLFSDGKRTKCNARINSAITQ